MRLVLIFIFVLTGCVSDKNLRNAQFHSNAANAAKQNGSWDLARREYAKAVVNADLGNAPIRNRSILYYEYGRATGVTCFFDYADIYLKKSLELDKSSNGPIHYPLIELARLMSYQKDYKEALIYFNKVDPIFKKLNAKKLDPIGYADYLDEYATALKHVNNIAKAESLIEQGNLIRSNNPNILSRTDRTPYGSQCSKN